MDDPNQARPLAHPPGDEHRKHVSGRSQSPVTLRLRLPPEITEEEDGTWMAASDSVLDSSDDEDEGGDGDGADEALARTSPRKRPARNDDALSRPFKRQKGLLNMDYLDLLNREIEDAAQRVCLDDDQTLPSSDVGLTSWSGLEKKLFYEAVARMGRDDLGGIAARVGSKSVVEVRQYLALLEQEKQTRLVSDRRAVLEMASFPAAVELSQSCCAALEETADTISVKQERREQLREEKKWGSMWDLTPDIASRLDEEHDGGGDDELLEGICLPSVGLFDLAQWLRLSRDIFMNPSIPNENWTYMDDDPPSIWATALEDFYSLAVSITRRLVQTTIFASMTRIRDNQEYRQGLVRNVIRAKDVRAAAASLNMPLNAHQFWLSSARRLRLNVIDDGCEEAEGTAPLSYERVEALLAAADLDGHDAQGGAVDGKEHCGGRGYDSVAESHVEDEVLSSSSSEDESTVHQEMDEVLRFSVADFPETYKMRQALKNRVATEQQQEERADRCDDYASYQAELEMWDMLQREPPTELPKMPEPPGPASLSSMNVESIFRIGGDWRAHTKPWSEWEVLPPTRVD